MNRHETSTLAQPVLASTLHDPDGRFLPHIESVGCALDQYCSVVVAATDSTNDRTLDTLRSLGVTVERAPAGSIGNSRRVAVRGAKRLLASAIFLCDFDRWLHWATYHGEELALIPTVVSAMIPAPWFVCIGRTARAFATHPRAQQEPEAATNRALELAVGFPVDAVAGAAWLSAEGASIVLERSIEETAATDLEWPALIHGQDPTRLAYHETEGLEFETATFYPEEIAAAGGYDAWIHHTYDQPGMWADRLRLAADSVEALVRVRHTSLLRYRYGSRAKR